MAVLRKTASASANTGRQGEAMAVRHLTGLRYEVLATNYRKPFGEIDIIARDGRTIVFIEVKTRRSTAFGTPLEAVDARKQRQLSRIAQDFLQSHGLTEAAARFDVIAVLLDQDNRSAQVEHIRNAFDACE